MRVVRILGCAEQGAAGRTQVKRRALVIGEAPVPRHAPLEPNVTGASAEGVPDRRVCWAAPAALDGAGVAQLERETGGGGKAVAVRPRQPEGGLR